MVMTSWLALDNKCAVMMQGLMLPILLLVECAIYVAPFIVHYMVYDSLSVCIHIVVLIHSWLFHWTLSCITGCCVCSCGRLCAYQVMIWHCHTSQGCLDTHLEPYGRYVITCAPPSAPPSATSYTGHGRRRLVILGRCCTLEDVQVVIEETNRISVWKSRQLHMYVLWYSSSRTVQLMLMVIAIVWACWPVGIVYYGLVSQTWYWLALPCTGFLLIKAYTTMKEVGRDRNSTRTLQQSRDVPSDSYY